MTAKVGYVITEVYCMHKREGERVGCGFDLRRWTRSWWVSMVMSFL